MAKKKTLDDVRPPRHDELVAELLNNKAAIFAWLRGSKSDLPEKPFVATEYPCGRGFIDLCISWRRRICREHDSTGVRGLIIEVKSELEQWSAGDVIRQLKGYDHGMATITERSDRLAPGCSSATCKFMRWNLCLFSGRELTESERCLLRHEHVDIVSPRIWVPAEPLTDGDQADPVTT